MLRRFADLVFAICLAPWLALALLLCMTIISEGWSGVGPKLIHVAGFTNNLAVQSASLVAWRLAGLLAITFGAAYFRSLVQRERR
jgi:hypothetical protein